ncbi:MAG TPA: hypothetical protein VHD89_04715 [Rhodanobacteraceae bacterium]|nr:hypothetical protein [Rhodanobacteraceae bacterium]
MGIEPNLCIFANVRSRHARGASAWRVVHQVPLIFKVWPPIWKEKIVFLSKHAQVTVNIGRELQGLQAIGTKARIGVLVGKTFNLVHTASRPFGEREVDHAFLEFERRK